SWKSSWCDYGKNNADCYEYGRLYDWNTALSVCPTGWHLPNRKEWQGLVNYAGGKDVAGNKLKSTSGWYSDFRGPKVLTASGWYCLLYTSRCV
ncbi:FISUMP domain-containing protein, partial [Treponema sp. R8-4-B8]